MYLCPSFVLSLFVYILCLLLFLSLLLSLSLHLFTYLCTHRSTYLCICLPIIIDSLSMYASIYPNLSLSLSLGSAFQDFNKSIALSFRHHGCGAVSHATVAGRLQPNSNGNPEISGESKRIGGAVTKKCCN